MLVRSFVRALVLLLFVVQGLAPFLHAHAGARVASSGPPMHLHLNDALAFASGAQWQTDEGTVVTAPPEVRRDGALVVADLPCAGLSRRIAVAGYGSYPPACPPLALLVALSRHAPLARAPPPSPQRLPA